MELKPFVKTAIEDVVGAVEESRAKLGREIHVEYQGGDKSIEFDIAVMAENSSDGTTKAGIRVLEFFSLGSELNGNMKQTEVSRIKFRVFIGPRTFAQEEESRKKLDQARANNGYRGA